MDIGVSLRTAFVPEPRRITEADVQAIAQSIDRMASAAVTLQEEIRRPARTLDEALQLLAESGGA